MTQYRVSDALADLKQYARDAHPSVQAALAVARASVTDRIDVRWSGDPELVVFTAGSQMLHALHEQRLVISTKYSSQLTVVAWAVAKGCTRELM